MQRQSIKNLTAAMLFLAAGTTLWAMGFPEDQRLEYAGVTELGIDAGIFDVDVAGGSVAQTEIEVEDIPKGFVVDARQRRGRVQVVIKGRPQVFGSYSVHPRISVRLPAATILDVEASTGDVTALRLRSDVSLRSSTGDIQLTDATGTIRIDATTGEVVVEESEGDLEIATSTGDVVVNDFQGVVAAVTTTGDIDITKFRVAGNSRFTTTTGDIDAGFQNATGDVEVDARSTTGKVTFENDALRPRGGTSRFTIAGESTTGDQRYR